MVGSELGRPDDGTDPTGFFNDEFYVGLRPYNDKTWQQSSIHTKADLIEDLRQEIRGLSRRDLQLHAAGRRRGGRSSHRAQELAGRENFRSTI